MRRLFAICVGAGALFVAGCQAGPAPCVDIDCPHEVGVDCTPVVCPPEVDHPHPLG